MTTIIPGALLSDGEQGWRRGATCHCHDVGHEAVTERLGTGPRTMSGTRGRRALTLTIRHRRAFRSISENNILNVNNIINETQYPERSRPEDIPRASSRLKRPRRNTKYSTGTKILCYYDH